MTKLEKSLRKRILAGGEVGLKTCTSFESQKKKNIEIGIDAITFENLDESPKSFV